MQVALLEAVAYWQVQVALLEAVECEELSPFFFISFLFFHFIPFFHFISFRFFSFHLESDGRCLPIMTAVESAKAVL